MSSTLAERMSAGGQTPATNHGETTVGACNSSQSASSNLHKSSGSQQSRFKEKRPEPLKLSSNLNQEIPLDLSVKSSHSRTPHSAGNVPSGSIFNLGPLLGGAQNALETPRIQWQDTEALLAASGQAQANSASVSLLTGSATSAARHPHQQQQQQQPQQQQLRQSPRLLSASSSVFSPPVTPGGVPFATDTFGSIFSTSSANTTPVAAGVATPRPLGAGAGRSVQFGAAGSPLYSLLGGSPLAMSPLTTTGNKSSLVTMQLRAATRTRLSSGGGGGGGCTAPRRSCSTDNLAACFERCACRSVATSSGAKCCACLLHQSLLVSHRRRAALARRSSPSASPTKKANEDVDACGAAVGATKQQQQQQKSSISPLATKSLSNSANNSCGASKSPSKFSYGKLSPTPTSVASATANLLNIHLSSPSSSSPSSLATSGGPGQETQRSAGASFSSAAGQPSPLDPLLSASACAEPQQQQQQQQQQHSHRSLGSNTLNTPTLISPSQLRTGNLCYLQSPTMSPLSSVFELPSPLAFQGGAAACGPSARAEHEQQAALLQLITPGEQKCCAQHEEVPTNERNETQEDDEAQMRDIEMAHDQGEAPLPPTLNGGQRPATAIPEIYVSAGCTSGGSAPPPSQAVATSCGTLLLNGRKQQGGQQAMKRSLSPASSFGERLHLFHNERLESCSAPPEVQQRRARAPKLKTANGAESCAELWSAPTEPSSSTAAQRRPLSGAFGGHCSASTQLETLGCGSQVQSLGNQPAGYQQYAGYSSACSSGSLAAGGHWPAPLANRSSSAEPLATGGAQLASQSACWQSAYQIPPSAVSSFVQPVYQQQQQHSGQFSSLAGGQSSASWQAVVVTGGHQPQLLAPSNLAQHSYQQAQQSFNQNHVQQQQQQQQQQQHISYGRNSAAAPSNGFGAHNVGAQNCAHSCAQPNNNNATGASSSGSLATMAVNNAEVARLARTDGAAQFSAKKYHCDRCQKSFTRSDMLTRHKRLHSGDRPFQCSECKQEFSRSDHLSTHMRTHTGEKPYKCKLCPYSACRKDMITRHMKVHNRAQGGRANSASPCSSSNSLFAISHMAGDSN